MTTQEKAPLHIQIWHFFVHLRLHYQFFILSGGYLLAGLYAYEPNWEQYVAQFFNIHVLLFGGATAYNSFWDKDEGPIGGLKHPPKMTRWMWFVSLAIQFIGLVLAYPLGTTYIVLYIISLVLFWLYSTPLARWKGHPIKSMIAIGLSTGTNSFLLGYIAAGEDALSLYPIITAIGVALIFLSLYPVSQVFQIEEDRARGDHTFATEYGLRGIRRFYIGAFLSGSAMVSYTLSQVYLWPGVAFGVVSVLAFGFIYRILSNLQGIEEEYPSVMRIKLMASLSFVFFIIGSIVIKNIVVGIEWIDLLFKHQT